MYSEEQISEAVAALNSKARRALHIVSLLQAVKRSPAVGRVVSKALVPILEDALPGCRVDVYVRDYRPDRPRVLYASWADGGEYKRLDVEVATKNAPRLTAEALDKHIEYYRQLAAGYLKAAESLPTNAGILNQAEPYLAPIRFAVEQALYQAKY